MICCFLPWKGCFLSTWKFGFYVKSSKICEIFRAGVLKNAKKTFFLGRKSVKKRKKCNFISLVINMLQRKCRKNKKKFVGCAAYNGKILFLQSQTTTIRDGMREGLSTGRCSLKEWKNVANTQEEEFEIRKRWGQAHGCVTRMQPAPDRDKTAGNGC